MENNSINPQNFDSFKPINTPNNYPNINQTPSSNTPLVDQNNEENSRILEPIKTTRITDSIDVVNYQTKSESYSQETLSNNITTPARSRNFLVYLITGVLTAAVCLLGILLYNVSKTLSTTNQDLKKITTQLNSVREASTKQLESNQAFQSKLNTISTNTGTKSQTEGNIANFGNLTKSIVKIYNISRSQTSSGTGTIIDKEGHILTNKHVIEESSTYFSQTQGVLAICITKDPEQKPACEYTAEIINIGGENVDLAVLKINKKLNYSGGKFQTSPLLPADLDKLSPFDLLNNSQPNPQLGSQINVLGYPGAGGDSISLTQGIYSGSIDETYFKTDAKVNSGNSGGATFDSNNKFLGVPTAVSGGQGNIGYIIKAQQVINFVKESIN